MKILSPKLLVITPTLGKSKYISATIASMRESGVNVQHLIIAPAESRISHELAMGSEIITEPPGQKGLYAAINSALAFAKGGTWTHFTYINDDDMFGPSFGEMFGYHCRHHPNCVGYGRVGLIDADGRAIGEVPVEKRPRLFEALLASGISPLNQQGMVFPRHVVDALGGFDLRYSLCADLAFWLRAHKSGVPFRHYNGIVGLFRIRAGQLSGDVARLRDEIRRVVNDSGGRRCGIWHALFARYIFRAENARIYCRRLAIGQPLRGMDLMSSQ